jgi:uncharacterized protein (TIGR03000 family)
MRKSWLVGAGVLALAAAALLLLPSVSQAQRRWGGRWGGGYGYDGWGRGYGGYNDGFGYGRGGYYGYNRGGYSPGFYSSGYAAPSYGYESGDYIPPAGETYYGGGAYATDQSNQGNMNQQQMPQQDANKALIVVRVPSNAQVFFEGQPTTAQGPLRAFLSPAIDPNKDYTYDVKATWNQNGRPVTQERHVRVHAGQRARVDFMQGGGQPSYGAGPGEGSAPAPREEVIPGPGARTRDQTNTQDQTNQPAPAPAPNDRNRSNTNPPKDNQNQNKLPNPSNP